jgi:hypothetical protein
MGGRFNKGDGANRLHQIIVHLFPNGSEGPTPA